MNFSIFFIILILPTSAFSFVEFLSQIKRVEFGKDGEEKTLVLLANGRVLKIRDNSRYSEDIFKAMIRNDWIKFKVNADREIESFEIENSPVEKKNTEELKMFSQNGEYNPSVLKSLDQARSYFYDAKINFKESQCYNRAHVWSYDWRIKYNLYSEKVWIYFTPRYLREFDFDWWFHVSPMVHVVVDSAVKERVMDIKYAKGPLKINQWTDIFMKNSAKCPVVEKYSEQANYPESAYCYLMKSSMYYYQPTDLEKLEFENIQKTRWVESEVRNAFQEAFAIEL